MKIKIERSGGLAGLSSHYEIESDKLPSHLEDTAKHLLNSSTMKMSTKQKKAADCFKYKITIQQGNKHKIIDSSELGLDDNVKALVRYVERNDNK